MKIQPWRSFPTSDPAATTQKDDATVSILEQKATKMGENYKNSQYFKGNQLADEISRYGVNIIMHQVSNDKEYCRSILKDTTGGIRNKIGEAIEDNFGCIQDKLYVLKNAVPAYRIFTEFSSLQNLATEQTVTPDLRDRIIKDAKDIKSVIPAPPSFGRFIEEHDADDEKGKKITVCEVVSAADVRFETSCLKQAAKWLKPPVDNSWIYEGILKLILASIDRSGIELWETVKQIAVQVEKDVYKSRWYPTVRKFEWEATNVKSLDDFKRIIPDETIKDFTKTGKKFTLGLVKIMAIIFYNPASHKNVKEKALNELIALVTHKPEYSKRERIRNWFDSQVDRYAETRSFAGMVLCKIGLENNSHLGVIIEAMKRWLDNVEKHKSEKYKEQIRDANTRLAKLELMRAGQLYEQPKVLNSFGSSSSNDVIADYADHTSNDLVRLSDNRLNQMTATDADFYRSGGTSPQRVAANLKHYYRNQLSSYFDTSVDLEKDRIKYLEILQNEEARCLHDLIKTLETRETDENKFKNIGKILDESNDRIEESITFLKENPPQKAD